MQPFGCQFLAGTTNASRHAAICDGTRRWFSSFNNAQFDAVVTNVVETFLHVNKPCTMWAQLKELMSEDHGVQHVAYDCLDIVWQVLHNICGLKRDYADYLYITHETKRLLWDNLQKHSHWPKINGKQHMSACLFVMARRKALRGGFGAMQWYNFSHGYALLHQYPYTEQLSNEEITMMELTVANRLVSPWLISTNHNIGKTLENPKYKLQAQTYARAYDQYYDEVNYCRYGVCACWQGQ